MSLKKVIETINHIRLDEGLDCPIAITGWEQVGKSTLAIQITKKMFYEGGPIDKFLEKYLAYTNKEVEPKINNMEKYGAIIGDETIRWAYNRNWAKDIQKDIVTLWRQIGFKKLLGFFNLPDFWELDKAYRNKRVKLWFHVFAKGHAVVYEPNNNPYTTDPWFKKLNEKEIGFISQFDPWQKQLKTLMKSSTFIDHIEYNKLPPEWNDTYERISQRRKLDKENREMGRTSQHLCRLIYYCHTEYGVKHKTLAKMTNLTQRMIQEWFRKGRELIEAEQTE